MTDMLKILLHGLLTVVGEYEPAQLFLCVCVCVCVYFASEAPDAFSSALENSPRRQKIRAVRCRCQPPGGVHGAPASGVALTAAVVTRQS